jgi:peroxiredoxin
MLQTNTQAPVFSLPDTHGIIVSPSEYRGTRFLPEFHAKDNPESFGRRTGGITR